MAPSIKEIFSKDNFKKNKKIVLLSAAVALLLVASVAGIAAGASKANENGKRTLSPTSHAVLRSACSSTLYPELCISAVATAGGVKLTSQKDVIEASLNLTTTAVEHNYFGVKKLIKKTKGLTPREKTALHDCLETIDETLDELHEALEDLHMYPNKKSLREHAGDLKTLISSAITNQETCLDGFSHDAADKKVRKALLKGQGQVLSTPTPELFEQEQLALQKWIFLRKIEEMYFRQRSRINWLKEGDQNTTYFFRIVQTRLNFNTIRSFSLSTGVLITDPLEMSSHAITHFQCILGPTVLPLTVPSPPSWFHSLTAFLCSDAQAAQMINIPTPEEIMKILLKLNPNKAPGPDGLTSAFYKASWDFLGTEVVQAIQNFFYTSFMPASTNATILTLVPKHTGASLITDYRPIACLNTIYKVVSRILVRKLKPLLPGIIVPNQTAFVKDRLLVENTSLAGQLVHGYHKSNGQRRITIKVDIAKAFDTLSWDFLFSCLQGLNLPQNYLHWLKACVCTTNFTIGYNGSVNGYFKGTRGLRQGDPLSPYLFVLAMNNLSLMLNKAAREMKFNYHKGCESSRMTHLCFADDLLIFMDGSLESVQAVLQILREFEHRSGLAVSVQKSSFFASGLSVGETELIQFSTGMPLGSLPVRYLGVPLCTKKLTLLNCEGLLQQIKTKFSSWSSKALSFAGRLLLIKTVITGITTFWCSTFILPKACVKRINSLCGVFLWKGDIEEHHTARVAWAEVTKPKTEGGLGIKDLAIWNKACCLKLIWLLFFQAGSVWVAWFREEILQGSVSNLWITKPSQRFSWQVNKILKLSGELFPWIKIRVENGATCRFWTDNWCPLGCLRSLLRSATLGIPNNTTLASLYYNGRWLLPPARSEAQVNLHVYMTTITLTQDEDYYEWEIDGQTSKRYSTGQVYNKLREAGATVPWHDSVWNKRGIPKQSFMTWLIVLDRCPTRDRLLRWGLRTDPSCLLCNSAPECRNHLYFDCSYAWQIWLPLAQRCGLLPQRPWPQVLNQMQALSSRSPLGMLTLLCWQSCMYWIWSERNSRLHRQVYRSPDAIRRLIDRQMRDKILSFRSSNPIISSRLMQRWLA